MDYLLSHSNSFVITILYPYLSKINIFSFLLLYVALLFVDVLIFQIFILIRYMSIINKTILFKILLLLQFLPMYRYNF